MTTYVMLANWTDQGALKVKDSPRRLDAAKKAYATHPERLKIVIEKNTGHAVKPEALAQAVDWFRRWL